MRYRARLWGTILLALVAAAVLLTAIPAFAGEEYAGTYGAPSLRIPVGAKLMSSPDILAGMEPDASLLFSNPAFLSGVSSPQVFLSTSNWLEEMRLSAISASLPSRYWGLSFSGGATLLYSGGLKGYDNALNVIAEESLYDMAVTGAVIKNVESVGLSLSIGGTYLRQHLFPADGSGLAMTVGAVYQRGGNTIHMLAKNIGGNVKFPDARYNIDSERIAGYGRTLSTNLGEVMTGVQMVYSSAAPTRLELGLGYRFNHLFSIRTSMKDVTDSRSEGFNLDAGFSIRYNQITVDYGYTPHEYFASTHTVSLAFSFRGPGGGPGIIHDSDDSKSTPATPPVKKPVEPVSKAAVVQIVPTEKANTKVVPPANTEFLLVCGTYSWEAGARDEARALELQGITASVRLVDKRYLVVLGQYENRQKAVIALKKLDNTSLSARIVSLAP